MARASGDGNFYEDFRLGETIEHIPGRTVTEGDAAVYLALTGDRYPLFSDAEIARSVGYPRELVNSLLVFHIVFGKSVPDISRNAVANLGYARVLFLESVFPGDTLRVSSEIIGKRENRNGTTGIVYVHTRAVNQHHETVLEFDRWVMLRKRKEGVFVRDDSVPDLPARLAAADLARCASTKRPIPRITDGPERFFEDYSRGQRIGHGPGMAIEEAEHASATRLYQNTAAVHFDPSVGKRLVYGGHVISIARALSYNGLEQAHRILAWNGGRHVNPVHAGDTIYAQSEVLETSRFESTDDYGAVRLRLIATKNVDPGQEEIAIHTEESGKTEYPPEVVLDWDYFVAMPRREGG